MEAIGALLVPKEKIPSLHFSYREVLLSEFERDLRYQHLYQAMILGNTHKQKVTIIFETTEGAHQVETTVWAAAENNIVLKYGIRIPICCIREVVI